MLATLVLCAALAGGAMTGRVVEGRRDFDLQVSLGEPGQHSAVEPSVVTGPNGMIAVIWRDFDPKATGFTLFITGLSNETAAVKHPVARDDLGLPVFVFLRKTLAVDYKLRGDSALRSSVEVAYEDQSWVMR